MGLKLGACKQMTISDASTEKLDIGRVIQLAVDTGRRQFVRLATLWGIALGGFIVIAILFAIFAGGSLISVFLSGRTPTFDSFRGLWPIVGLGFLIAVVFGAVSQAASLSVAIGDISGRSSTLEEDFRLGLRKALPMIAVSLLFGLAVGFGFILLIVPGIMVALALSQALPAVIGEKIGFLQAFDRSRYLTRNNRWRLLGLWAVVGLAYMVLSMILAGLTGGFSHRGTGAGPALFAVNMIESLVGSVAGYCIQAAAYAELRRIKDGVGAADLGAIFD